MPGEPWMCIWDAVYTRDIFPESGCKRMTVKSVTETLAESGAHIRYDEAGFDSEFKDQQKVAFANYMKYFSSIKDMTLSKAFLVEDVQNICWEIALESDMYHSKVVDEEHVGKLWQVFTRVCKAGSYPPRASKDECNWLFERVAQKLGKTWISASANSLPESGLTFKEMLERLDTTFFLVCGLEDNLGCIDELYSWLVREVMNVGYLQKRTRKRSNWTNWLKRWFVLTPGKFEYFDDEACEVKKGQILVDANSVVESQAPSTSFMRKLPARFKITNKPTIELEMCASSDVEKQAWLIALRQCVEAAKTCSTPVQELLKERAKFQESKEPSSAADNKLDTILDMTRTAQKTMKKRKTIKKQQPKATSSIPEPEEFDNNVIKFHREKVQGIFFDIDKDGNGKIDKTEFRQFITGLGVQISQQESDLIFDTIDTDGNGNVNFDRFYEYFIKFVAADANTTAIEAKMRAAFLAADKSGSGTISFREFSEFAVQRRQQISMSQLVTAFDNLDVDKDGEISFKEFRKCFDRSSLLQVPEYQTQGANGDADLNQILESMYNKQDSEKVAQYLKDRWKVFAKFRRYGEGGDLVMKGSDDIVADLVPGEYSLIDLACFNDLPPIQPQFTEVKGIKWVSSTVPGKSGSCEFPADFDGRVPIECATDERLAYYGCSLATGNKLQVSLLYRHGIQDFTYENNYIEKYVLEPNMLGGGGIERHGFAHLDCPLEEPGVSGAFLVGKLLDDKTTLHLTAFRVPKLHAIYVPPFVIHCNDYLKGTWRTMLSDEAEIDHCNIVKVEKEGLVEKRHHFLFDLYDPQQK